MDRKDTRQAILDAAFEMFSTVGYDQTNCRAIALRAGVNQALVKYHFGSKEELAECVIKLILREMMLPRWPDLDSVDTDEKWREELRRFMYGIIDCLSSSEYPNCYIRRLYLHEATHPSAKKHTLHGKVLFPIFRKLEDLMSLAVKEPIRLRAWSVAIWGLVFRYAVSDPVRARDYLPKGVTHGNAREIAVNFVLDEMLAGIHFNR